MTRPMRPEKSDSPLDVPLSRFERALKGLLDYRELDGEEQEKFFDGLGSAMDKPTKTEDAIYEEIRKQWEGFELDEYDNLLSSAAKQAIAIHELEGIEVTQEMKKDLLAIDLGVKTADQVVQEAIERVKPSVTVIN